MNDKKPNKFYHKTSINRILYEQSFIVYIAKMRNIHYTCVDNLKITP